MTLKQLVERKCLTCGRAPAHEDVAKELGVHPTALSHWINRRRKMTAKNAYKIAINFGVTAIATKSGDFHFE